MRWSQSAVERAMKFQEVMLRAMSGEISWQAAAEIVGITPRRCSVGAGGTSSTVGRVVGSAAADAVISSGAVPGSPADPPLYRERFVGFNGRIFHQIARREHGVTLSYSFVKRLLQEAGLLRKYRARGVIEGDGSEGLLWRCCWWMGASTPGWP